MNAGAIVAAKQNRYIRRLRQAGAVSPADAVTLEQADCRPSRLFNGLVSRGVVIDVGDGRYYLDSAAAEAFRSSRRSLALLLILLGLLAVVAILWFRWAASQPTS